MLFARFDKVVKRMRGRKEIPVCLMSKKKKTINNVQKDKGEEREEQWQEGKRTNCTWDHKTKFRARQAQEVHQRGIDFQNVSDQPLYQHISSPLLRKL